MAQAFCDALPRLRIEFAINHRAAGNGRALTGHRLVAIGGTLVTQPVRHDTKPGPR